MMSAKMFYRRGMVVMAVVALTLVSLNRVVAQTTLFSDNFDRANSRNIDATLTGITDNTGQSFVGDDVYTHAWLDPNNQPPTYGNQDGVATDGGGAQISGNTLQLAVGSGTSDAFINHNFTNASILASGGFSVTLDITAVNQSSLGQGGSLAIGMSLAEAQSGQDAFSGVTRYTAGFSDNIGASVPAVVVSDFWVALRADGSLAWGGGPGTTIQGVTGLSKTGTIQVNFALSDFNSGSTVNYEVFYNGASKGTGAFTWSGTAQNYIGLDARDNTAVGFDNLSITTLPEMPLIWLGDGSANVWNTSSLNWSNSVLGVTQFANGKVVLFDDTSANTSVSLPGTVLPSTITLNNNANAYTFGGGGLIGGTGSVSKTGNGIVMMSLGNTFSGGATLYAGSFRVGNNNALGSGTVTFSGGALSSDGATARALPNAATITSATTFGDATDHGLITLNSPVDFSGAGRTITTDSDVVFAGGAANGRVGSKRGAGTLTIKGVVDYNGASDVQDGTLIYDGAVVTDSDRVIADAGSIGGIARLIITNGASVTVNTTVGNLRSGRTTSTGSNYVDLAGLYSLPNADAANGYLSIQSDAAYSEVTFWPGGDFTARGVASAGAGSNPTVFRFNGGILRARNDNPNFFEGLSQTLVQSGGAKIDDGGYSITINQDLLDGGGGGGLTKWGGGMLTLAGANTFSGTTVVSNGTLLVTGTLSGGGGVNVVGGAFGGSGVVAGSVTVQSSGMLSPGASVGTLTIGGNLTLTGGALLEVDKSLLASNDYVNVSGALTYTGGGTIIISNVGPAYAAGDSFKFFSKPLANGAAATFAPAAPAPGMAWTNRLAVDGTVGIVSTPIVGTPADLIDLTLSVGTLSPAFSSNILGYTASAPYSNSAVTLTPTTAHPSAIIRIICNGVTNVVASGVASDPVALNAGANTIDVQVTAPDDSITKDYIVAFKRIPPNVVVILADDQGFSDWGCYGSEIPTPNIDQLAASGLRFRQFYNTARCSTTRCALLTGLYTHQVAVDPAQALPNLRNDNNVTIAELLQANGYRTYMAGKWHLGNGAYLPEARGFEQVWRYANGASHSEDTWNSGLYTLVSSNGEITNRSYGAGQFYQSDVLGDYSFDFVNNDLVEHADGKPFFLYMAFGSAHFPIQAPKAWVDTNASVYAAGWDVIRNNRYANILSQGVLDARHLLSPNEGTAPWSSVSAEAIPEWNTLAADRQADLARRMAVYAAMVQKFDQNVGRVVDRLRDLGQLDNTLIFVMSDNGGNHEGAVFGQTGGVPNATPLTGTALANMGLSGQPIIYLGGGWAHVSDTPFRLYKHFSHEGGIRSPLIVHWPQGVTRTNEWEDQPSHLIDIMASIVDATGVSYPTQFNNHVVLPLEGQSLKALFTGTNGVARTLGFEHESNRAWLSGGWKLVTKNFTSYDGSSLANELELYDLTTDPVELTNLATVYPSLTTQMATNWNNWATRVGVPAGRLITIASNLPTVTPAPGTNDLFVDTFERSSSTDADASADGMWGSRVPPLGAGSTYYEGYEGSGNPTSIQVLNGAMQMAVDFGMSENGIMHNFIGPDIVAAGGFSVELTVQSISSDNSDRANRYVGFGVGLSQTEAAAGGDAGDTTSIIFRGKTANTANPGVSDFFVELDIDGNVKVWHNGTLLETVPVGPNVGTLTASFACAGFTTNDTVTVTVYFNGQPVDINTANPNSTSRTFQWDRNDSNYIGLSARALYYAQMDNLAIRKLPIAGNLAMNYAMQHGLSGADADPGADPEGDHVTNFGEWAFGGDPTAVDPVIASLTGTLITPTYDFQFDYQRLIDAASHGVQYRYFVSEDMKAWTEVTPVVIGAATNEDYPTYEIVTVQLPAAAIVGKDNLFLRVLAEPVN